MRRLAVAASMLANVACSVSVPSVQNGTFACSQDADCDQNSGFTCVNNVCTSTNGTSSTTGAGGSTTAGSTTGAGGTTTAGSTTGAGGTTTAGGTTGSPSGITTVITAGPGASSSGHYTNSTDTSGQFAVTATNAQGVALNTFSCQIDNGIVETCPVDFAWPGLNDGPHVLAVAGVDNGTVGSYVTWNWHVDTVAPAVTITNINGMVVTNGALSFSATCNDNIGCASNTCSLDGGAATACANPQVYSALAPGHHNITVVSTDVAGNTATATAAGWVSNEWVAAGFQHTCAMHSDNTLYCWGAGDQGQLGYPTMADLNTPATSPVVTSNNTTSFVAVAANTANTCGIDANLSLYCWGSNSNQQTTQGPATRTVPTPTQIAQQNATAWAQVAVGDVHACAIDVNGALSCWGDNSFGQSGVGPTQTTLSSATREQTQNTWLQVATGDVHTCALDAQNDVWCWGNGYAGQLANNSNNNVFIPNRAIMPTIASGGRWTAIAAGGFTTCAIYTPTAGNGNVYCWGDNSFGQAGNGNAGLGVSNLLPQLVQSPNGPLNFVQVAVGEQHVCAIAGNPQHAPGGTLWCWGSNQTGQVAPNVASGAVLFPTQVGNANNWMTVSAGWGHTCGYASQAGGHRALLCWGNESRGQLGNGVTGSTNTPTLVTVTDPNVEWQTIAAGGFNTCANQYISGNYRTLCWGDNLNGQVGNGLSLGAVEAPVSITPAGASANWYTPAVGAGFACAIFSNPNALPWCWGQNDSGQLARDSYTVDETFPGSVWGLSNSGSVIAAGAEHACFIDNSNNMYCWGDNTYGQLGVPGVTSASSPQYVSTTYPAFWVAQAPGGQHTCAIESGTAGASWGQIYCWGDNSSGQLGIGSIGGDYNRPQALAAPAGAGSWFGITSGDAFSCAISSPTGYPPGTLYCWGDNGSGQVAPSAPGGHYGTPNQIGATAWNTVVAGGSHACGVRASSCPQAPNCPYELVCWGDNFAGQLGLGANSSPGYVNGGLQAAVLPPGATAWLSYPQPALGALHTCAAVQMNVGPIGMACWGDNTFGQLGNSKAWLQQQPPSQVFSN